MVAKLKIHLNPRSLGTQLLERPRHFVCYIKGLFILEGKEKLKVNGCPYILIMGDSLSTQFL